MIRAFVKLCITLAAALAVGVVSVAWRGASAPRAWAAEETPVAFWAWRNQAPTEEEVARVARESRAHALFLRAGQIDYAGGQLRRIRTVAGRFPRALPLHLVYNGTRSLLVDFEGVDANALAATIIDTFAHDAERARREGAQVVGLQLDIDSPTRLLPRYARVVRAVRARLPEGARLSVTGLVTWMDSPAALNSLLDAVDFWIPQCYGAEIPARIERAIPISSPEEVRRAVARAREFRRPFYAGLSSYGYALLYSAGGSLIALRGDLDPARVARDPNFELLERRAFGTRSNDAGSSGEPLSAAMPSGEPATSEWRYVFRARNDAALDGLTVRAGDRLMVNLPSVESLRAAARAAREEAGEHFLGLCLFRLPTRDDPTAMPLAQVAAALADNPPTFGVAARLNRARRVATEQTATATHLRLTLENNGTASALMGDDALSLTLRVPAGSLRGVNNLTTFFSFETLCGDAGEPLRPCSARRANVVRLKARAWTAGAHPAATLSFDGEPPAAIQATIAMRADDGQTFSHEQVVTLSNGEQP